MRTTRQQSLPHLGVQPYAAPRRGVAAPRLSRPVPPPLVDTAAAVNNHRVTIVSLNEIPAETAPHYEALATHTQSLPILRAVAQGALQGETYRMVLIRDQDNKLVGAIPLVVTKAFPLHSTLPRGGVRSVVEWATRLDLTGLVRRRVNCTRVIVGNPFAPTFAPIMDPSLNPAVYAWALYQEVSRLREERGALAATLFSLPREHPLQIHLQQYGFISSEAAAARRLTLADTSQGAFERYLTARSAEPTWAQRREQSRNGFSYDFDSNVGVLMNTLTRILSLRHNADSYSRSLTPQLLKALHTYAPERVKLIVARSFDHGLASFQNIAGFQVLLESPNGAEITVKTTALAMPGAWSHDVEFGLALRTVEHAYWMNFRTIEEDPPRDESAAETRRLLGYTPVHADTHAAHPRGWQRVATFLTHRIERTVAHRNRLLAGTAKSSSDLIS